MAQLKVYSYNSHHVYDERVRNILTEPRIQTRYSVYVAAYSKADAIEFTKNARSGGVSQSELRVAAGNDFQALREAVLFEKEGTVLVTSDYGGKRPVVLCAPDDGDGSEGTGAQAIGILRPAEKHMGYVFEATAAEYAGRGSIAVGAEHAYVKVQDPQGRFFWQGTSRAMLTDEEMQRRLDLGDLTIMRSGFGDWFRAGR